MATIDKSKFQFVKRDDLPLKRLMLQPTLTGNQSCVNS